MLFRSKQGGFLQQRVDEFDALFFGITPREAARLMGLPDSYRLPATATGALHVAGDGVAVPVVRWLARELLEPLLGPSAALAAE